jgi:threonine dehydratase
MEFVTLEEIRAARQRIENAALYTPMLEVPSPSEGHLFLKCENLQPMGAFKIRGAFNMIAQLPADALKRGVVTYSSGNHGQAVALAAKTLGAPAVIVMPTTAPAVKVEGCKGYGAEVIMEGTTSLHRQARAEKEAGERGLTIVPPFDHPQIIIGQGTTGLEILEQCPDAGTVFVPAGGGGLVSGVAAAIKLSNPSVRIVAVEPAGAPKVSRSLEAGHPVTLESSASIADGLMNLRPGAITFAHIQKYVDEVVTVSEVDIAGAVAWLFKHARIVAEPSGAITTAAVSLGLGHPTGKVVAIVTGGNVAPEKFATYIA